MFNVFFKFLWSFISFYNLLWRGSVSTSLLFKLCFTLSCTITGEQNNKEIQQDLPLDLSLVLSCSSTIYPFNSSFVSAFISNNSNNKDYTDTLPWFDSVIWICGLVCPVYACHNFHSQHAMIRFTSLSVNPSRKVSLNLELPLIFLDGHSWLWLLSFIQWNGYLLLIYRWS